MSSAPVLDAVRAVPPAVSPVLSSRPAPSARPEIEHALGPARGGAGAPVVEKPLSVFERLFNQGWLRKLVILAVLAGIWEAYGRYLDNDLLFPTFSATWRRSSGASWTARCRRARGRRSRCC